MTPTTHADMSRPECLVLPYRVVRMAPAMGRTSIDIVCPFCLSVVTAYTWSLAGGGKRCGCGALLGWRGRAYKMPETPLAPR